MGRRQDPARKLEAVLAYRSSQATEKPRSLQDVAAEYGMGVATLKRANWNTPHDGGPPPQTSLGGRPPKLVHRGRCGDWIRPERQGSRNGSCDAELRTGSRDGPCHEDLGGSDSAPRRWRWRTPRAW